MSEESLVSELLLRWRELQDQGQSLSEEELCRDHPELVETVRRRLHVLGAVQQGLRTPPLDEPCPPLASVAPPQVSGYEILGTLGRGGMGVVWKARQVGLKRLAALKMIRSGGYLPPEHLARFRREAEAVARLRHPNIVQIYEIREEGGMPFFSLEYVEGGTLAESLKGQPQPPRQAAALIETLACAIHYAHTQGVIHRDLKPSNVLLTADGLPKITDFGLAKCLDDDQMQTRDGDILGTPSYMAPEQAAGRPEDVGAPADIYALGAILYEMLTGRPPFTGHTLLDTLEKVRIDDPIPPRRLQPGVPRDLQTICLNCLQKDPQRRYSSAAALAADLHGFLAGEPIQARPAGAGERLVHWGRRRPVLAVLLLTATVALVGLGVGLWWQNAVTVSAVAVLSLLLGSLGYSARLRALLRQVDRQQIAAERNMARLHLLLETTRRLLTLSSLDQILRLLSETTARLANAERATIFLIDAERKELWSKCALGDGVGEIRVPLGVGIAGTVALTGETINLADAYADPRFNPAVDRRTNYRTRSLLALPLLTREGQPLGVFQILNRRGGPFEVEDLPLLEALAASAAVVIENTMAPSATGSTDCRNTVMA